MMQPWRILAGCVLLRVHLTPRSNREGIDAIGMAADRPMARVRERAMPEVAKANAALENVLADWLGIG
jgi:uncharacterized protein